MSLLLLLRNRGEGVESRTIAGVWVQEPATWSATATATVGAVVTPRRRGGRLVTTPFLPTPPPSIEVTVAFVQEPATWRAVMDVNTDEPLLLSDLLELVA